MSQGIFSVVDARLTPTCRAPVSPTKSRLQHVGLREENGSKPPQGDAPAIQKKTRAKEEREITCAACGGGVTREKARIAINGAHVHTFKNPSAIDYTIGCFDDAYGCVGFGERSRVWTWFPGFAWQVALCGRCGAHLGWSFDADASRFWGLILDRLSA